MPQKCYYRAGKDFKGKWEDCIDVVKRDKNRVEFIRKLKEDKNFREKTLRWTKKPVEEYVKEYEARANYPGDFIQKANPKTKKYMMCSSLYVIGQLVSKDDKKSQVVKENGKTEEFDNKHVCPYDESHDASADEMPDDVCSLSAFGEAALLLCMRKRLCAGLNIYTYVGDIVLCLNPYMYLPEMVDIVEYPDQWEYKMGERPSSYSSAHFAYWGTMDEESPMRNQSCIVSGESGAGKTVACGFIMKYLAKLSNWRKMALNEWDPDSKTKDITKLVAGVSPFLEMFGNAKTNMNDNSSRFGKFTKIWFKDGKIIGAELVHYLLEKARLAGQGEGERSYHVFYGLVRGATPEEQAKYNFKSCDDYPLLCEGGSSLIGHGHGPEYDVNRFNADLHEDPDDTGMRAALTAAEVSKDQQSIIWDTVAGILKLLTVDFEKDGDTASKVKDQNFVNEVAVLMGVSGDALAHALVVIALKLPGKTIESPQKPSVARDNRNALAKEIYGRVFAWLIQDVCNGVLMPSEQGDAFVGLLDIFGFEVMPKNSIEQLCINFANEKLQQLFNRHVFDDEEKAYKAEGIPTSAIPPHGDNTPCCNLVSLKSKSFQGLFPRLDDLKKKEVKKDSDAKWVKACLKDFGAKKGMNKKAKTTKMKQASKYVFGDPKRKKDYVFTLCHYAGDILYDAREFLSKNKDKLPLQLTGLMETSKVTWLKDLFDEGKQKGKKFDTLASKYLYQLKSLSKTLTSTNPHYVRCIKPNDIKYRPVDGDGAFNDWKTYRQLLYAGVMEVVKIKKEGFPFREKYDFFWSKRCVANGYHKLLDMDANMDPKDAATKLATEVLPGPKKVKDAATGEEMEVFYWTLGNTMLFAKDDTLDRLRAWHQQKLAGSVQEWWRYWCSHVRTVRFAEATIAISLSWRSVLNRRKYAKMEVCTTIVQSQVRCIKTFQKYRKLAERHRVTSKIQKAWRSYHMARSFAEAYFAYVHQRAAAKLDRVSQYYVDKAKSKLAKTVMAIKIKRKFQALRLRTKIQARTRGSCSRWELHQMQKILEIERNASFKAEGLYSMRSARLGMLDIAKKLPLAQALIRGFVYRMRYRNQRRKIIKLQAFCRMMIRLKIKAAKLKCIVILQKALRMVSLTESYEKKIRAAERVQAAWKRHMWHSRKNEFGDQLRKACNKGDVNACVSLLKLEDPKYTCLHGVPTIALVNISDPFTKERPIHFAAQSGDVKMMTFLLRNGAISSVQDDIGESALHKSVSVGDRAFKITRMILQAAKKRGAAERIMSQCTKENMTPYTIMVSCDNPKAKTAELLSQYLPAMQRLELKREKEREDAKREEMTKRMKHIQERHEKAVKREREEDTGFKMLLSAGQQDTFQIKQRAARKWSCAITIQSYVRRFLVLQMLRDASTERNIRDVESDDTQSEDVVLKGVDPEFDAFWKSRHDDSGRIYYFNTKTGHTSWVKPAGFVSASTRRSAKTSPVRLSSSSSSYPETKSPEIHHAREKRKELTNQIGSLRTVLARLRAGKELTMAELEIVATLSSSNIEGNENVSESLDLSGAVTRSLYRCLQFYQKHSLKQDDETSGWYYIDAESKTFGPFKSSQMKAWHRRQELSSDLLVRFGPIGPFVPLKDIYPVCSDSSWSLGLADLMSGRRVVSKKVVTKK